MNNENENKREDSEYEEEINKLSIGDIDAIFSSAAAKENSEDIEDVLKRELRLRAKIDEAEKKLEEGREKLNEMATKKKEELDREMNLMQDKNSLEFGLIASDLDAELKKMAEESEIAKKRNEALKEELRQMGCSRLQVWQKGVDTVTFNPQFKNEEFSRRVLTEERSGSIIGCVGRLGAEKNLYALKETLTYLPEDTNVAIIGCLLYTSPSPRDRG